MEQFYLLYLIHIDPSSSPSFLSPVHRIQRCLKSVKCRNPSSCSKLLDKYQDILSIKVTSRISYPRMDEILIWNGASINQTVQLQFFEWLQTLGCLLAEYAVPLIWFSHNDKTVRVLLFPTVEFSCVLFYFQKYP